MLPDFTSITWKSLMGPGVVVGLVLGVLELLKRGKIIAGTRAIYIMGFLIGQAFAQVAFWRCLPKWSAQVAVDAALVGFLASFAAIAGHTMGQKLLEQRAKPDPAPPP